MTHPPSFKPITKATEPLSAAKAMEYLAAKHNWLISRATLYNWANLADNLHFPKRGCVGWYQPAAGRPKLGTIGTELEFAITNVELLDAFGA